MALKQLPLDIQSFSRIREGGYLHVDKAQHNLELLSLGDCFFLSPSHRFNTSFICPQSCMLLNLNCMQLQGKHSIRSKKKSFLALKKRIIGVQFDREARERMGVEEECAARFI